MNTKILFVAASLITTLITAQNSLAQSAIQINESGMVLQSGNTGVSINNVRIPTINQNSRWINNSSQSLSSVQSQRSAIALAANNLRQPCILSITSTNNALLSGQITLDGKVIKKFRGSRTVLNLSPYLARGINNIKISGNYQPLRSSVKIEFSSPNNKVSQQISGNGKLNQVLVFSVQ